MRRHDKQHGNRPDVVDCRAAAETEAHEGRGVRGHPTSTSRASPPWGDLPVLVEDVEGPHMETITRWRAIVRSPRGRSATHSPGPGTPRPRTRPGSASRRRSAPRPRTERAPDAEHPDQDERQPRCLRPVSPGLTSENANRYHLLKSPSHHDAFHPRCRCGQRAALFLLFRLLNRCRSRCGSDPSHPSRSSSSHLQELRRSQQATCSRLASVKDPPIRSDASKPHHSFPSPSVNRCPSCSSQGSEFMDRLRSERAHSLFVDIRRASTARQPHLRQVITARQRKGRCRRAENLADPVDF